MKNLGSRWSEISCGLRLFFLFAAILVLTSHASGDASQLTVNPSNINFGSVFVGGSQTQSVTLANSGGPKLTVTQASLSGTGFTLSGLSYPVTLAGGQSVTCNVTFAPQSPGTDNGSVAIAFITDSNGKGHNGPTASSSAAVTLPVSGTGVTSGQLTANPASLSFGSVTTGSSTTLETLTNSGGSTLTISQITQSGTGFSFSGITPPLTLGAAQSVTFNVSFAPQSGDSVTGSLVISSNGSNPTLSVSLTGTGTLPGQLAVAPSAINFGNVVVGTTQNQTGTLSASNAPVTVSSVGASGSEFSVSGLSLPVTIAAGNGVSFQVTFAPQASGTASANITFASNASNAPTTQSLSGSGTPPPQHSVALSWNASTSSNVVGYNVYRGTVSGGPYAQINSALDATTSDTDSTAQGGQTYYYVVTAADSTGAESSYSSQIQAVIPYP